MTDQWTCPTCQKRYVVPSLADQCHQRHDTQEEADE